MLIAAGAFLTDVDIFPWKIQSEFCVQQCISSKARALSVVPHILSPRPVSPFLTWGDFHVRSRFARSTIPEKKWGTTRSLLFP